MKASEHMKWKTKLTQNVVHVSLRLLLIEAESEQCQRRPASGFMTLQF